MTDTIKHHLSDSILMGYSAGTLPEAFNLMVAAHISLCDTCRAHAASFDAVGGELLESDCAEMEQNSLTQTLALIAGGAPTKVTSKIPAGHSVLPGPLQDYVGGDLDNIQWKPVGMGVKQAILKTSSDATARLLFIPAGAAMPDHGHKGTEMTMVLKGAFKDEDDYFARGDVEMADQDMHHTPVADIHEDCICLAVSDAPLRFNALIPKILQPFLKI